MSGFFKRNATRATKATAKSAGKVVNAGQIVETAGTTIDLARSVITPTRSERRETFAHAVLRRGLTEHDLAALHRQHSITCSLFLLFMTMAAGIGIHSLLAQGSITAPGAAVGAFLVFLGYYIRSSFRAAQIEARALFEFSRWLRHPSLWVPAWTLPPAPARPTSTFMVPND